jgi:hypothetical protein
MSPAAVTGREAIIRPQAELVAIIRATAGGLAIIPAAVPLLPLNKGTLEPIGT